MYYNYNGFVIICTKSTYFLSMKNYIVLFRESGGRISPHAREDVARHRDNWQRWLAEWAAKGNLAGGNGLTLESRLLSYL